MEFGFILCLQMRPSPTTVGQVARLLGDHGVVTKPTHADGLRLPASTTSGVSEIRKVGDLWWYRRTHDGEWVTVGIDDLLARFAPRVGEANLR